MTRRATIALLIMFALGACGADRGSPSGPSHNSAPTVVIGGGPGLELELLAEVYAQALEAAGYAVRREPVSDDAVALYNELDAGSIDLAPERVSELLAARGEQPAGAAPEDLESLRSALALDGLTALEPSQAERRTGFGLRHERASELEITTMSELAAMAEDLTWGLPTDCSAHAECRRLLSDGYGIDPGGLDAESVPACDPGAAAALNEGIVDVAMLCTTQPEVERFNLVVLEDDRQASPSGAFVPVIRDEVLARAGDGLALTLAEVGDAMTTAELTSLVARITIDGERIPDVARTWLEDRGLA